MAITQEFSLQNTTVEIFDNSTSTQRTALTQLRADIKAAPNDAGRVAAYDTFFTTVGTKEGSATVTGGSLAFTNLAAAGDVGGTWKNAGTGSSGTWLSNAAASTTSVTADMQVDVIGTLSTSTATGFVFTVTTGGTGVGVSQAATITSVANAAKISKVTAIGDTGKTFATISAKLVSESGTIKAKGSSDEGDLTIDYISIPSDAGQVLMESAFDDESINGNRVFRITHTSSGAKAYMIGMVGEIKKTRGSVDNFASCKAKITLQDGVAEYYPA